MHKQTKMQKIPIFDDFIDIINNIIVMNTELKKRRKCQTILYIKIYSTSSLECFSLKI